MTNRRSLLTCLSTAAMALLAPVVAFAKPRFKKAPAENGEGAVLRKDGDPWCCKIGCRRAAEWEVNDGPTCDDFTQACSDHVGHLLQANRISSVSWIGRPAEVIEWEPGIGDAGYIAALEKVAVTAHATFPAEPASVRHSEAWVDMGDALLDLLRDHSPAFLAAKNRIRQA